MYKEILNTPQTLCPPLSLQWCLKLPRCRNLAGKGQTLPSFREWLHLQIECPSRVIWMLPGKRRHKGAAEGCVPEPGQPVRGSFSVSPVWVPPDLWLENSLVWYSPESCLDSTPWFYFQLVHFLRGLMSFTCAFLHVFAPSSIRPLFSLFWAPFWSLSLQNTADRFAKTFSSWESCQGRVTLWKRHPSRTKATWVQPCLPAPLAQLQTTPGFSEPPGSSDSSLPAALTPAFPVLRGGNRGPCQVSETIMRWGCLSVYCAPLLRVRAQSMPLISRHGDSFLFLSPLVLPFLY